MILIDLILHAIDGSTARYHNAVVIQHIEAQGGRTAMMIHFLPAVQPALNDLHRATEGRCQSILRKSSGVFEIHVADVPCGTASGKIAEA